MDIKTSKITKSIKNISKKNTVDIKSTQIITGRLKENSENRKNDSDNKLRTGAITFLDILGWKGIWSRDSDAIQKLERLAKKLEKYAEEYSFGRTDVENLGYPLKTEIKIISDTIVIITNADKSIPDYAIDLHGELSKLAIYESIILGIPFRGATCFGEYQKSDTNNILVGKAVDEAASWHEKADWIGVFLTPTANFLYNHEISNIWVKYSPPLKDKQVFDTYSVSWLNDDIQIDKFQNHFAQMSPILPEFIDKFQNTIKFLENIQKPKKIRKIAGEKMIVRKEKGKKRTIKK